MTRALGVLGLVAVGLVQGGCSDADTDPPTDGGTAPDAEPSASFVDPLSAPAEPTHDVDEFEGAEACGGCHETHYDQWRKSMHAYAMVDPVFRALVRERQREFEGAQDRFCLQCHSAIATRGGEIVPGFDFDELSDISLEGVTCEACHKVAAIERRHNSGHRLDPGGPIRGPIEDPVQSGAHESEYGPEFETSEFCSGCHDVIEVSGLNLERPYEEWLQSPDAGKRECQSCHMPSYTGRAAEGAPERELHAHTFVGVDVPLSDGFVSDVEREELRDDVRKLLTDCASVKLDAPDQVRSGEQVDLLVTVQNQIDAHNFPTGSTAVRQAWLEITATDANGDVLYRTGDLDENGDLRDVFSDSDPYGDQDLIGFHSSMVDALGAPEIFSWRAAEHFTNSLSPGYKRTFTLFVPTDAAASGTLTVSARLRFRTHPPYLLRALGLDELIERVEIYDVADAKLSIEIIGETSP